MSGWLKKWWWIALVGCVVLGLWLCNLLFLYDETDRGLYGDMFGAVNALFSGFAFAGVVIAILLQKEELALQRKELELTRSELEGQKEQLEKQCVIFQNQRFDDIFFQLIRLHNDIVKGMKEDGRIIEGRPQFLEGKSCFKKYYEAFRGTVSNDEIEKLPDFYRKFYINWQQSLGHYFRNLYNMVEYVHRSGVENKKMYMDFVRAQLSTYELLMLFYNCLSDYGHKKFKPLVEEHGLLKNLDESQLLTIEHKREFADSAFSVL